MNEYSQTPPDRDPRLWQLAQRRAAFKYHLGTYVIVNAFFWVLWYFKGQHVSEEGWPWPIWPMIGWGIGLLFHYLGAYVFPKESSVEREYEKLKKQQGK